MLRLGSSGSGSSEGCQENQMGWKALRDHVLVVHIRDGARKVEADLSRVDPRRVKRFAVDSVDRERSRVDEFSGCDR